MNERSVPRDRTVLSIRLDGLALPSEVIDRIASAVRKAVLLEVADLDLASGVRVQDLAAMAGNGGGGGGTQGVAIVAHIADIAER